MRILIAKDAISTGWDCPRAEVMVSFRAAKDQTHITQLAGAHGADAAGAAHSRQRTAQRRGLPASAIRQKSVEAVVMVLMTGGEAGEELPGRRVLINPREMKPNPLIPEEVWEKLLSLPSQTLA